MSHGRRNYEESKCGGQPLTLNLLLRRFHSSKFRLLPNCGLLLSKAAPSARRYRNDTTFLKPIQMKEAIESGYNKSRASASSGRQAPKSIYHARDALHVHAAHLNNHTTHTHDDMTERTRIAHRAPRLVRAHRLHDLTGR